MKNKLLRLTLITLGVILSLPTMAQTYIVQDTIVTNNVKYIIVKEQQDTHYVLVQKKTIYPFTPSHEFNFSIGAGNATLYSINRNINSYYYNNNSYPPFSNGGYEDMNSYYRNGESTGALSVGYSYNATRRFSISATLTYAGVIDTKFDRATKREISKNSYNNYMFMPTVKFNYLERPNIQLYSEIGFGIGCENISRTGINNNYVTNNKWFATGQFTYLGVSVGRKLFGFIELGFGHQGSFIFGIGYRFNEKNKR